MTGMAWVLVIFAVIQVGGRQSEFWTGDYKAPHPVVIEGFSKQGCWDACSVLKKNKSARVWCYCFEKK
jgi:hypothetical protein